MHFGECDQEFLDIVARTSVEGDNIHNAVRMRLEQLMLDKRIKYESFEPQYSKNGEEPLLLKTYEQAKTDACIDWLIREKVTILKQPEQTITSPGLGYGGTPDLVCRWRGMNVVIDFKSGDDVFPVFLIQLESYAQLVEKEKDLRLQRIAILKLEKEGSAYAEITIRELSQERRNTFMRLLDQWYRMFPEPFLPFTPDNTPTNPEEKELVAA